MFYLECMTGTGMKLDILIQVAVEHVLTQKSEESAKCTVQVTNINEDVSLNVAESGISSGRMS